MTTALTLMAKDKKGPKVSLQVLFVPATHVIEQANDAIRDALKQ